jgi:hypothetical protein
MSKWLCVCAFVLASSSAQADYCRPPPAAPPDPYQALAGLAKREFQLLLNEYMFVHRWTRHAEAISAGFRPGSRVYGEVLKTDGQFNSGGTAAWRNAYGKAGRSQYLAALGSTVDMATVDPAVIEWVIGACLGSGLWSELRVINECRFVLAAGLVDAGTSAIQPVRFEVRGGRCARWPARSLTARGESVSMRPERHRRGQPRADDRPGRSRQTDTATGHAAGLASRADAGAQTFRAGFRSPNPVAVTRL